MDGSQFDALTKALASGRSRRGVLGALAGAALAAAGLSRSAEARRCRSTGNTCAGDDDCCSGNCVAEGRTRKICHCASAGDCPAGDQCHAPVCAGGVCGLQVTVNAACDDGDRCTTNDRCQQNGSCAGAPVVCDDRNACTTDACEPATGQCVFTPITCDDGDLCTKDACDPGSGCVFTPVGCPPAPNECFTAGTCQPETGACSSATYHGDGAACSTGVCHANVCCAPEDKAITCAGGKCGPQTNNCGQTVQCLTLAGGGCGQDGECCSGICVTDAQGLNGVCQAGPVVIGGACDSNGDCASHQCCAGVCRDLSGDADNCGGCGAVCSNNNMATRTCAAGACDGTCAAGFSDCDGNKQTNGCETDTGGDPDNCGSCGTVCSNNHMATRVCTGGVCSGACASGFADCDGNKQTDGCEIDLMNDRNHCGSCVNACPADPDVGTYGCSSGGCVLSCPANDTTCDGFCRNLFTDALSCGLCGQVCPEANVCNGGTCTPGCRIDGTFYDVGDSNPAPGVHGCQTCQPLISTSAWTTTTGTPCMINLAGRGVCCGDGFCCDITSCRCCADGASCYSPSMCCAGSCAC